jgi:hypothetical protein
MYGNKDTARKLTSGVDESLVIIIIIIIIVMYAHIAFKNTRQVISDNIFECICIVII